MRVAVGRLIKRLFTSEPLPNRSDANPRGFEETCAAIDFTDAWISKWRREASLYVNLSSEAIGRIREYFPLQVANTLQAAECVLAHQFDLLGSGPFVPFDSQRADTENEYKPIDWFLDPVSGLRFPENVPSKQWSPTMAPASADVKLPWELSRCQHWVALGQAYRLTRDERYVFEIVHELDDFTEANPIGIGINWVCTMDVALRAANWALALELIKLSNGVPSSFWERAVRALLKHGLFIYNNLENKYEVTSNHFLSNLVGLYYVGSVLRGLPETGEWLEFCRASLEREIEIQVLEDGADYESSVPYHRLVTELFLGTARLASLRGEPFSEAYRTRLRKMVHFLAATLRPDGLMPQIGDADDGRLHIFGYGWSRPQDPRHIFAPAALALDEPEWLIHAGPCGGWEAAWWGFDIDPSCIQDGSPPETAELFPDAGLAIFRRSGTYLIVTNGRVGTKGFGNHKHNDQLGFEFHAKGIPLVVDPGSFVYTADAAERNLFRSTAYHNTLSVDAEEQNELRPEWLFRLFERAHPEHLGFNVGSTWVEYRGQHVGYRRLKHPVSHERTFHLDIERPALYIRDRLEGAGTHFLRWHFHLAPEVSATQRAERIFVLNAGGQCFTIGTDEGPKGVLRDAWYSPSYGVRVPCQVIDFECLVSLSEKMTIVFAILPGALSEMNDALTRFRDQPF